MPVLFTSPAATPPLLCRSTAPSSSSSVGLLAASLKVAIQGTAGNPGRQTITATDTANSADTGTSAGTAVHGLFVNSLLPTPTGFVATFSEPVNPSLLNLYDSTSSIPTGQYGPADVTLVGPGFTVIRGSLVIDPTDTTITFIKTSTFTSPTFNPATGVLAPGNYSVTFRSASNGFVDLAGDLLDGNNDGLPGDSFSAGFSVGATPVVVGVPAFARRPNGSQTIELPNNVTSGIPINLSNGSGVTSGRFSLQYNPALLDVTGVAVNASLPGATLTLDPSSTPGNAVLVFTSSTPLATGVAHLGGLTATVPNSAAASYAAKVDLHFAGTQLNGKRSRLRWAATTPFRWWPILATFLAMASSAPSTPRLPHGWRPRSTAATSPTSFSTPPSSATSALAAAWIRPTSRCSTASWPALPWRPFRFRPLG